MRTLLLLLPLSACAPDAKPAGDDTGPVGEDTESDTDTDADSDTDTDTDTDTDADPCTATVTGLSPADGAVGVAIDTPVVATFSEAVSAADIALDNGVSGTVVIAGDGLTATFTADATLSRGATYTATASVCESELSASFTTLEDQELEVDLTGRTYDIELDNDADLTWVKPSFGSILAGNIETTDILFMVESVAGGQLDIVGAAGYERSGATVQYPCTYAIDFDPTDFSANPSFTAGPRDAEMDTGSLAFAVYDLAMTGAFSADGDAAHALVMTGLLDTREMSESMGFDVCAFASGMGDDCTACPDGEDYCLELEVHDEAAPYRSEIWLDKMQDPTTDRYCQ